MAIISPILLFLAFIFSCSFLYSEDSEIFHAKRISDLWKCGEVNAVKIQINDFLLKFPNSVYKEQFFAILGDCSYYNHNYKEAIQLYHLVTDGNLRTQIFSRFIDSLKKYDHPLTTIEEIQPYISNIEKIETEEERIYSFNYALALIKFAENLKENESRNSLEEASYFLMLLYEDCKETNSDQALYLLSLIINHCKSITYYDHVLHQRNCILYTLGKWEKARKNFISFLDLYPKHAYLEEILKHILICSENELISRRGSNQDLSSLHIQWLNDLNRLEQANICEIENYFKKFEAYTYLKNYPKAIESLKEYIEKNKDQKKLSLANYLIAECYFNDLQDFENFIFYAKNAIALNSHFKNDISLNLHLFHSYISLFKTTSKQILLDDAINHLIIVYTIDPHSLDTETVTWLYANLLKKLEISHKFVLKIFDPLENKTAKIAIQLFHHIKKNPTPSDSIILAKLLAGKKHFKKSLAVLKKVHENLDDISELKHETSLLLGKIYEYQGDIENAVASYQKLLLQSISPSFQYIGKLCLWDLQLQLNPNEKDQKIFLKEIKTLEVRRNFNTEPLHLEAGLIYAKNESLIYPSESQQKKFLENLYKLKNSFLTKEGIVFKDYHLQREKNEEKNLIFQRYMTFIDATISLLEANYLNSEEEKTLKKSEAKSILESLKKNNLQNTLFLPKWLDEALKENNELFRSH